MHGTPPRPNSRIPDVGHKRVVCSRRRPGYRRDSAELQEREDVVRMPQHGWNQSSGTTASRGKRCLWLGAIRRWTAVGGGGR
jgi:hypothetical protein